MRSFLSCEGRSISRLSIVQGFSDYFDIRLANTPALKQTSYQIRHQVYCEELGWEPETGDKVETDPYDDHSLPLLLYHKVSKTYAGTMRLVVPPTDEPGRPLPFEVLYGTSLHTDVIDLATVSRSSIGEISRLCVPGSFRRRAGEKNKPFVLNDMSGLDLHSAEDQRNFPKISVGLYIGVIALTKLLDLPHIFVVTEPRLMRRLQWLGIPTEQAGDDIEHRGTRALFYLDREYVLENLKPEMRALLTLLEEQLATQIS